MKALSLFLPLLAFANNLSRVSALGFTQDWIRGFTEIVIPSFAKETSKDRRIYSPYDHLHHSPLSSSLSSSLNRSSLQESRTRGLTLMMDLNWLTAWASLRWETQNIWSKTHLLEQNSTLSAKHHIWRYTEYLDQYCMFGSTHNVWSNTRYLELTQVVCTCTQYLEQHQTIHTSFNIILPQVGSKGTAQMIAKRVDTEGNKVKEDSKICQT